MTAGEGSTQLPPVPYIEVPTNEVTARFWSELAEGRIVVDWSAARDTHVWPPSVRCRTSMAVLDEQRTLPGTGRIYTYTIIHRPARGFPTPTVLAYIELDGGPVVMANVVDSSLEQLQVGARVEFVTPEEPPAQGAFRFRVTSDG